MNTAEQAELLSRARTNMPAPVFNAMLELAREALGPERWAALARRLGLETSRRLSSRSATSGAFSRDGRGVQD